MCSISNQKWQQIKRIKQGVVGPQEYASKIRVLPKDALGVGEPNKDLHVTWGHGLLLKEMKEEWKNDEYDGNHVTYSKADALVKGDFIKLLAGHCSLCRKPNKEERKKAKEAPQHRARFYHLEIADR